ncbi:MAG: hypothetical protein UY61_C0083G0002 [Candidatus Adlerbacteria bacterium GW2011_GWC1_50_9]|uniref:Uncharacterized protein n=1 Tax=Candidatus Adlerbacteria bacterium GW2011_GWC1_50_9 TaxID=1618608 RepID=A0A0G1YTN9_9BACT|nr:MAG: hypothetical protein UY61_C0083G0002 [Candidatus Adlerbacteria bacterium GW2011_GWC1_50_9]
MRTRHPWKRGKGNNPRLHIRHTSPPKATFFTSDVERESRKLAFAFSSRGVRNQLVYERRRARVPKACFRIFEPRSSKPISTRVYLPAESSSCAVHADRSAQAGAQRTFPTRRVNPCAEFPDSLAAGMNAHEERGSGKT